MADITEVLDLKLLLQHEQAGYVRAQTHPEFPELIIYNYTEKAQYERMWDSVTKITRGLIWNTSTGEVLARPFPKIHNWDETEAPRITWESPLYAWSDKEDGSLGIVYRKPDGELAVATRGSFASEQALHATALLPYLEEMYGRVTEWEATIDSGFTPLVEIVYPENRIVLNYGGRDELIGLGSINIDDGYYIPDPDRVQTPRTFAEIMGDLSRENAEGWVVWLDEYKAVKVKQADYVELHRVVTGLNQKSVWRSLREGYPTYKTMLESLPDELTEWAEKVGKELLTEFSRISKEIDNWYLTVTDEWYILNGGSEFDRGEFARLVKRDVPVEYQSYMFSLLDGRPIEDRIWQKIEPAGGGNSYGQG